MLEMDRTMTTDLWNYSSYNQALYQRYDRPFHAQHRHHHHHHHHHVRGCQTPDAMTPIFKSSEPYCSLGYAAPAPPIASESVPGAWNVVRDLTGSEQQWPAAVTGHVLGRATDAAAAMVAAAQRGCRAPYTGIGV